jgi:transcriptional regulator with XRE-family HTH domain
MSERVSATAVGRRLRRARVAAGLSQRQLAEPGMSYAYYSRIEAGDRLPSVRALRKLAPKLHVSVSWLETGKDDASYELARWILVDENQQVLLKGRPLLLARRVLAESVGDATSRARR